VQDASDQLERIYREQREALAAIRRGEGAGARLGLADWVMEEVLIRTKKKESEGNE